MELFLKKGDKMFHFALIAGLKPVVNIYRSYRTQKKDINLNNALGNAKYWKFWYKQDVRQYLQYNLQLPE